MIFIPTLPPQNRMAGMSKGWLFLLLSISLAGECMAQLRLPEVIKKYEAYQKVWARPKIYLSFNQEKYTPGDTVFFKAYVLNQDLTPVPGKQMIYISMVDSKGTATTHLRFHVMDGIGESQLILHDTLQAGTYRIQATNHWMRNFDVAYSFTKKINIVRKHVVVEQQANFLYASPEGGHLIQNLVNRIGVYSNLTGVNVYVLDEIGQEVGSTVIDLTGTGSILFIPTSSGRYTVRVQGYELNQTLPPPHVDGCALRLDYDSLNRLHRVSIRTPVGSPYRTMELFLVATARGKICKTLMLNPKDSLSVSLPSTEFPTGVVKVSLLDPSGKLISYGDFYNETDDAVIVNIKSDQPEYITGEKVKLAITITDRNGNPVEGEFSLRVLNDHLFKPEEGRRITDALLFQSELKIDYPFTRTDTLWKHKVNQLLMAVAEPLPWQTILNNTLPRPPNPSVNVIERVGKAYFKDSDKPLPDLTQVLLYLQKNQFIGQTFTTQQGSLSLTIPDFYGDDELFYLAQILRGPEVKDIYIKWEEDFFPSLPAPGSVETDQLDEYGVFMERKRLIDQSFGIHSADGSLSNLAPAITNVADVLEPDVTIHLDDYILFTTMAEVINEIIPSLQYRHTKKEEVVRVNLNTPMRAEYNPLYIIDGVATKDSDLFLTLKPSEVKTIKVVNQVSKLLPTGLFGRHGIVIVETRNGMAALPEADKSKLIKGLTYPISFKNRSNKNNRLLRPDFRSTLYWNPSIKTDGQGRASIEFISSDDPGNFRPEVNGLTHLGYPFSGVGKVVIKLGSPK